MDEIKRMQQLAGLNEIKINNPNVNPIINKYKNIIDQAIKEWKNLGHNNAGDDLFNYVCKTLDYDDNSEGWDDNFDENDEQKFESDLILYSKNITEDISNFHIGQSKTSDGHRSTVTDVDPTTQAVTWKITKEVTDKEIWDDLTKLLKKFEAVQTRDFHSKPKLIQLIKDLKTIRNKFARTISK